LVKQYIGNSEGMQPGGTSGDLLSKMNATTLSEWTKWDSDFFIIKYLASDLSGFGNTGVKPDYCDVGYQNNGIGLIAQGSGNMEVIVVNNGSPVSTLYCQNGYTFVTSDDHTYYFLDGEWNEISVTPNYIASDSIQNIVTTAPHTGISYLHDLLTGGDFNMMKDMCDWYDQTAIYNWTSPDNSYPASKGLYKGNLGFINRSPYINGIRHNAYYNGEKVWGTFTEVDVPLDSTTVIGSIGTVAGETCALACFNAWTCSGVKLDNGNPITLSKVGEYITYRHYCGKSDRNRHGLTYINDPLNHPRLAIVSDTGCPELNTPTWGGNVVFERGTCGGVALAGHWVRRTVQVTDILTYNGQDYPLLTDTLYDETDGVTIVTVNWLYGDYGGSVPADTFLFSGLSSYTFEKVGVLYWSSATSQGVNSVRYGVFVE